jgi:PII-like signaling protein
MKLEGDAKRVTIFIGESDRWQHRPLYTAMVEMLRQKGIAGATVVKGIEGFGKESRLHTASILRLSEDLPVILTFIDTPEQVDAVMPQIDEMVVGGLVIVEDVHVRTYSDHSGS